MKKYRLFFGAAFSLLSAMSLQAGQYFQDFSSAAIGATNFSDGSQLFSTSNSVAQVVSAPYNELQLTASGTGGVNSAYELPDQDPGWTTYAFSAKWNMPVSGNFPNAADGFSFNFGQLSSLNLASNTIAQESGYGTGLSFDLQTYSGNNPGFHIRVNGAIVATVPYNPQTEWGVNNSARHFFEVDWNYYTGMTVRMDGQAIFSNVAVTGFTPHAGDRFVFAARCGGLSETIRLDNIAVVTGGNLVPLPATGPYYTSGDITGNSRTNAFDGDNSTYWFGPGTQSGYVGATFEPPNPVAFYTLTSANTGTRGNDPHTFTLDGNYEGAGWATAASGTVYFQSPMETRCFPGSIEYYDAYRLNITANNGAGFITLGELRLYAFSQVSAPYADFLQSIGSGFTAVSTTVNGNTLWACSSNNGVWSSTNYGGNWKMSSAPVGMIWRAIACDAAGDKIYVAGDSTIYRSTNFGADWTMVDTNPTYAYTAVACSSNGVHVVAASQGHMSRSDNSGANWHGLFNSPIDANALGMSADGSLVGANDGSHLTLSDDGGTNWSTARINFPVAVWRALWFNWQNGDLFAASSAGFASDGIYQAPDYFGDYYWTQISSHGWNSYTMSDDETFAAAVSGGKVYTKFPTDNATPPPPALQQELYDLQNYADYYWSGSSGGNFIMQQSSDLRHWTNVIFPVFVNYGDFLVTVPLSSGNAFYRLKTQ